MSQEKSRLDGQDFRSRLVRNVRSGSEEENIFEDEKEATFDNIPLIKPPMNYKKIVNKFSRPGDRTSSESSIMSSRRSSPDVSDDSMSA
jgi:hypothetical protein